MVQASAGGKLKVFVSYSRRDSGDFAEELVAGLELAGFSAYVDRQDIAPGEAWEQRLGVLIQQADTVVYVISPEAVKSSRCEWEVHRALALSKRLLPIIWKSVPESEIPEELRRRQFIRFDVGAGVTRPLAELAKALRQDLVWIREHTRLGELADRWQARGCPEGLLLRGEDVVAAESWALRQPAESPDISDLVRAFITASKKTETAFAVKSKAAHRRVRWAQSFVAVFAFAMIAGLAAWWNQDLLTQRIYALTEMHPLTTAQERGLNPKDSFKECADCPEMIVVPKGSFMMGSSPGQGNDNERPLHNVTIPTRVAVARFASTFAEWDACVRYSVDKCNGYKPYDQGWGRDRRPVINVSWNDIRAYLAWLSKLTGSTYRLLNEAEYEYATRGGTTTAYPWGNEVGSNNANCYGCGGLWYRQSAPVGTFAANSFGLYDMVGNAAEWVKDCWHESYIRAPSNGAAWLDDDCPAHVVRGGSWNAPTQDIRSAYRQKGNAGERDRTVGFRIVRPILTP